MARVRSSVNWRPGATSYDGLTAGTIQWVAADRIRFESTDGRLKVEFVPYPKQPPLCE